MTVTLASKVHFSSVHGVAQPTTTLLDCMLHLMQDLRDPQKHLAKLCK